MHDAAHDHDRSRQADQQSQAGHADRSAAAKEQTASTQPSAPAFKSWGWRAGDAFVTLLARVGIGPMHLLTTTGRTTGKSHTVPVVPVNHDERTWLVAPYGAVSWVHNVRADGNVSVRYGRSTHRYTAREASAEEAGPVLKRYVAVATKTQERFEANKDSPVEDFVAEADRHPVFELISR